MVFAALTKHKTKMNEREKIDIFLQLARKLKNTVEDKVSVTKL